MASEKAPADVQAEAAKSVKERLQAKTARCLTKLREEKQRQRDEEDAFTEKWSGLRITDWALRKEKWDASMRGKELIPLDRLASLSLKSQDKVVIGVLCKQPALPKPNHRDELCCEWTLTNLDKDSPEEALLILVGRAMEHWASQDGFGRQQATTGSIIAVLNPQPTGRSNAIRASFETQVIKLGMCPWLTFCQALSGGLPCKVACSNQGSGYCARHARQSHAQRQAEQDRAGSRTPRLGAVGSRRLPRPAATPARASSADSGESEGAAALLASLKQIEESGQPISEDLYQKLGNIAQRPDAAGQVALKLRRKMRTQQSSFAKGDAERLRLGPAQ